MARVDKFAREGNVLLRTPDKDASVKPVNPAVAQVLASANPVATQALICAWIKVSSWTNSWESYLAHDDWPANTGGWGFQRNGGNDEVVLFTRGSGSFYNTSCGSTFAGQGWINVCGYISSGTPTMRCYKNGTFQTSTNLIGNPFGVISPGMGISAASSNFAVAEVTIWTDLTQTQAETSIIPAFAKGVTGSNMPFKPVFYAPL